MLRTTGITIHYEVKDLVQTIDFYNILLGDQAGELYPGHARYTIKNPAITLTFEHNPSGKQSVCGNFDLLFYSDEDVFDRFSRFTGSAFSRRVKIDRQTFGPNNHAFHIADPDGIRWSVAVQQKKINTFRLFNIPRMTSMWDILKPI